MNYWEEMRDKYGFNDGETIPAQAYALRAVYVRVLNALMEKRGSKTRVASIDRPGLHNDCLIDVVSTDDDGKQVEFDEIGDMCLQEAMEMELDDFVTVVVTIDDDAVEDFIINNLGDD